ncbi:hypothetical protein FF38_13896 [Lucilia cuprina]|uniref:Protein snakeskin n=1 Tax=Lucilia cuprina TaxID=7375 RepID=A0A0L0BMU5_LUCCU|nr:hypothetical protein FF38_13896 [Lucilia cuprina]
MQFNNRLILKIIELIFTIICIVLIECVNDHSYSSQAMLICGTLTGYLIICTALAIGELLDSILDKRLSCLFNLAGFILFIATGAVIIVIWSPEYLSEKDRNSIIVAGAMAIVIAIVCIILWETNGNFSNNALIVCGTMGGFTIICGVLLLGHIINSVVEKRLNGLFSIIGCVLFVISGALIIDQWHDRSDLLFKESKRNALAAGSLMIINGAVFLMDTISIFRT